MSLCCGQRRTRSFSGSFTTRPGIFLFTLDIMSGAVILVPWGWSASISRGTMLGVGAGMHELCRMSWTNAPILDRAKSFRLSSLTTCVRQSLHKSHSVDSSFPSPHGSLRRFHCVPFENIGPPSG